MNWRFEDFEPDLKELKPSVKEKAIEIANKLLKNGKFTDQGEALKEGIKQAEEWFINMEG
ncbi:hypothetical protein BDE36_3541 [Arcticibacter tournemirensis]|uniref:Uncharacterized protein n=1 Tax=Arcticibacter tournemirensis TaxID=699437 RepID=A0A5M9GLJ9_9SPHI|nr:hypothetical protein [Arcticibacter tournemirensis]KAA8475446.1 hypothetical protein F1649_21500 [Arcticibacter tournemirensis]TQM51757.1 hypothetical protein BDE36_3541 [Arcticibacter tournemirensis]